MIKIMKAYANDDEDQVLAEVDGELKRCPFCGSEGEIYGDGDHYYSAACSKCPVEIVEFYFTLEEAVAVWNRRAEAEKNEPLTLEELREMDGEPVWVCDPTDVKLGLWSLVDVEYDMCVPTGGGLTLFEKYGKTWFAYRRKPEEAPC